MFHDCMPYEDGLGGSEGGCDGCLNFKENIEENNVLQRSVAILVGNRFSDTSSHSFLFISLISF